MFDIFAESREQARSEAIPWGELEGKRVLITGATGLIGFACAFVPAFHKIIPFLAMPQSVRRCLPQFGQIVTFPVEIIKD